jgi:chorismate mutase
MQNEHYTSVMGADAHATSIEQRTAKHIRTAVSALVQRIIEQLWAANNALLTHV